MTKKFFIIAAEASGDVLGAKLIAQIKRQLEQQNEKYELVGVGGNLMQQQGLRSIFSINDLSVMGVFEVALHIPKLLARIRQTAQEIINFQPDYVITIDAPDFNFRVMRKLKKISAKTFDKTKKIHLIAPSVWAYREGRSKKVAQIYDLLLAILPFEPPYFTKHGLRTVFIGHPIVELKPDLARKPIIAVEFRQKHKIKNGDIILCVTPGSRNSEVKKIFPEFIAAINLLQQKYSNLTVAIPLVEKTEQLVKSMVNDVKANYVLVSANDKVSCFFASNYALAKSGTNTVELSLYQIPMIVAYRFNYLTGVLAKLLLKIKFANLINIILNRQVIPELIQENCTTQKIFVALDELISNQNQAKMQIEESKIALDMMGMSSDESASAKAAREILKLN